MKRRIIAACCFVVFIGSIGFAADDPTHCPTAVTPPKATYAPDPSPPDSWSGQKRQATVVVGIVVDKKGKPRDLSILRSSDHSADKNALDAVSRWKFKPAKCGKDPIEVKINVEVNFRLD